jgi:hypothetical protein
LEIWTKQTTAALPSISPARVWFDDAWVMGIWRSWVMELHLYPCCVLKNLFYGGY